VRRRHQSLGEKSFGGGGSKKWERRAARAARTSEKDLNSQLRLFHPGVVRGKKVRVN